MLDPTRNRRGLTRNAALLTTAFALLTLLPLAALRAPAADEAGHYSGAVFDPSGRPVANATVIMTNNDGRTRDMTVTGRDGLFHFGTLPPGSYELQIIKDGFALYSRPQVSLEMGRDLAQNATLELGSVNEMVEVMSSDRKAFKPSTPVLRVGANVQQANLITKVNPVYPPSAKAAHVEGAVLLKAVIGKAGVPLSLHVLNSDIDPDLAKAAVEAVSQWRYRPTLLNGDPVEVISNITVNFTLSQ